MCCLKYEEDNYEQTRRNMPKLGKDVETPEGFGTVIDLNVLKETVTVRVRKGDNSELKTFPVADVRWFRPPVAPPPKAAPETDRAPRKPPRKPEPIVEAAQEVVITDDAFDDTFTDEDFAAALDTDEPILEKEPLTEELYETGAPSNWQQAVADALRNAKDSGR